MRPHVERFTVESPKSRQQEPGIDLVTRSVIEIQSLGLAQTKTTPRDLDSFQFARTSP